MGPSWLGRIITQCFLSTHISSCFSPRASLAPEEKRTTSFSLVSNGCDAWRQIIRATWMCCEIVSRTVPAFPNAPMKTKLNACSIRSLADLLGSKRVNNIPERSSSRNFQWLARTGLGSCTFGGARTKSRADPQERPLLTQPLLTKAIIQRMSWRR